MPDKSLALSVRNIYETFAICVPTLFEAARNRVTKEVCDERLAGWCRRLVENAKIDLEVVGKEHLGTEGRTFVIMSNHQSLYDVPVIFDAIGPNIRMITKKELFRVPVFGRALAAGGFVSIDRDNRRSAIESLAAAKNLLATGTHVWIAPEGTRSKDGRLLPFKKGGFHLALEARLPILPVSVRGTRDVLRAKGLRSVPGVHVRLTVHPPIEPAPYVAEGKRGREHLLEDVRRAIEAGL